MQTCSCNAWLAAEDGPRKKQEPVNIYKDYVMLCIFQTNLEVLSGLKDDNNPWKRL